VPWHFSGETIGLDLSLLIGVKQTFPNRRVVDLPLLWLDLGLSPPLMDQNRRHRARGLN
jgi:hypothetical protein